MTRRTSVYHKEIDVVKDDDYMACTLDQLQKKPSYSRNELYKIVNECLDKKTTKKYFDEYLQKMTRLGLAYETFTNNGVFRITLSPVGSEVQDAIRKSNQHLQVAH